MLALDLRKLLPPYVVHRLPTVREPARLPAGGLPRDITKAETAKAFNHRREHVVYESPQFRAGTRAPAVGKAEYKKGSDSGVLSQAVSYLSWLESAHHEVEALVRKVLGPEAAESIDWRRPRMVCIAASFSRHDRVAVQRLPERIDLVRYRVFEGGLLSLLLVDSSPGAPSSSPSRRNRVRDAAADLERAVPLIRRAFEAA